MPRRKVVKKSPVPPDSKYNSQLVTRFINALMKDGKKSLAEKILYDAIDILEAKTKTNGLKVFMKAIDNVKPQVAVKSRRVGGSTYQVPVEVPPHRQLSLSIKWIIGYSRAKSGKTMAQRLADEMLDAYNHRGLAVKKKEDTHKMAEANKAFAHYRW